MLIPNTGYSIPQHIIFPVYRDWNHHNRPDFSELVTSLAGDTHVLLDVPPSSLVSLEDPKKASILGAPLISAQHLYKEFQQLYSDD